ncbi:MAG: hypothetical protein HY512_02315 [Candidatus Aenigmarchaeota archaeon]|nr:hypothetical protein [Candidatus Aenigmarchaeota archaeon]
MNPKTRKIKPIIMEPMLISSGWYLRWPETDGKKKTINPPKKMSKIPARKPRRPNIVLIINFC